MQVAGCCLAGPRLVTCLQLSVVALACSHILSAQHSGRQPKQHFTSQLPLLPFAWALHRLQAAARQWRHEQLVRMAAESGCEYLALGHTATERAETVLFNMIRCVHDTQIPAVCAVCGTDMGVVWFQTSQCVHTPHALGVHMWCATRAAWWACAC